MAPTVAVQREKSVRIERAHTTRLVWPTPVATAFGVPTGSATEGVDTRVRLLERDLGIEKHATVGLVRISEAEGHLWVGCPRGVEGIFIETTAPVGYVKRVIGHIAFVIIPGAPVLLVPVRTRPVHQPAIAKLARDIEKAA